MILAFGRFGTIERFMAIFGKQIREGNLDYYITTDMTQLIVRILYPFEGKEVEDIVLRNKSNLEKEVKPSI